MQDRIAHRGDEQAERRHRPQEADDEDRQAERQAPDEGRPPRGHACLRRLDGLGWRRHPSTCCRLKLRRLMYITGRTAMKSRVASAAPTTVVEELEDLVEHAVGHDVVIEPSAGRHVDDVEDLEGDDGDGRRDRDDRAADHRHDHPDEDLALVGAIEPGRLEDLTRHALDRCREDDHGETGLEPDQDQDLAEDVDRAGRQPRDRLATEADHDRVQESDLRLAGGLPGVDEAPDDRCADERDRQRQEDDGLGQRLASDAIEEPGDDEPEHDAGTGPDDQPDDVVAQDRGEFGLEHAPRSWRA